MSAKVTEVVRTRPRTNPFDHLQSTWPVRAVSASTFTLRPGPLRVGGPGPSGYATFGGA